MRLRNLESHGVDVVLAENVILELTRGEHDRRAWGVWGIRIDGVLYMSEPRDLDDEPLPSSPFVTALNAEVDRLGDDR